MQKSGEDIYNNFGIYLLTCITQCWHSRIVITIATAITITITIATMCALVYVCVCVCNVHQSTNHSADHVCISPFSIGRGVLSYSTITTTCSITTTTTPASINTSSLSTILATIAAITTTVPPPPPLPIYGVSAFIHPRNDLKHNILVIKPHAIVCSDPRHHAHTERR